MVVRNVVCYSLDLNACNAMAHLRLNGPLGEAGINIVNGIEGEQVCPEKVREGELVIFQRNFPRKFPEYQKVIEAARREGKPVVFDLDDLLLFLPENHPDRLSTIFSPSLLPMYQALLEADLVTVSTPMLKEALVEQNKKIVILPNYFNDRLWQLRPPVPRHASNKPLILGFMGTYSHTPDLETIQPVLAEILKRYSGKLIFHCFGMEPPAGLKSLPQVVVTPWVTHSYKDFAAFFQNQSVDIFIAPLEDNLFNRCKSFVKYFEYSALGAPGIYSRLDPYEAVIKDGENGLLAVSLEEWEAGLVRLIENDELRYRLAVNAQAAIAEKWLLSRNAYRWRAAYQNLSRKSAGKAKLPENVIGSINTQLQEAFSQKDDLAWQVAEQAETIRSLDNRMAEKTQMLEAQITARDQTIRRLAHEKEEAEMETVSYALSTSWKITRPLRRISNLFKRKK
jgi:glycosyltransferase involved in cell wall biosynthesis